MANGNLRALNAIQRQVRHSIERAIPVKWVDLADLRSELLMVVEVWGNRWADRIRDGQEPPHPLLGKAHGA